MIRLTVLKTGVVIYLPNDDIGMMEVNEQGETVIYPSSIDETLRVLETPEQIEDMILRDQFAMSAMNGIISCSTVNTMTYCNLAKSAYYQADAMLKQRKEK